MSKKPRVVTVGADFEGLAAPASDGTGPWATDEDASGRRQITSIEGIPALSLDAISSVAYGPEAMLVVLATAGAGALAKIEPITIAIVILLAILVFSYRQVIEAYPDGGGSYTVSKANLGPRASHLAAACLVVDYVLTVAVSIAAGVAALVSAFPSLGPDVLPISVGILVLLTALNLRGIATSARTFLLPTAVFVIGIYVVIVSGIARSHPAAHAGYHPVVVPRVAATVGVFLLLQAFANGCSALTGIEAIANDVPAFRAPKARRAMRTEALLGGILGSMLLGLAFLTVRFHIGPVASQTVLSQITRASVGRGPLYYVIDLSTTVILALAANTSFGGLPVLASLLARDNLVPHVFGLRAERPVYRYGVVVLAVLAGLLLIAVDANTNALIPLYAIGVFTGFTLAQSGLVRHWAATRSNRWRARAALNGTGAIMTAVATIIFLVTKFSSGAWVVAIAIPALILLFSRISKYYADAERELSLGSLANKPAVHKSLVIVTVTSVSRMTQASLGSARSLSDDVVAVSVQFDEQRAATLRADWDRWDPGVDLVILRATSHSIAKPMLQFLGLPEIRERGRVLVLIPEVEPHKWRHRLLQNQRDVILANVLHRRTEVIVARVPFRLRQD
ncbi:MAG: APC family permease [Actinomycetota bacterium]|jgi:amino acid transporter|nr:APC family permease [Actinomycetota bacterium]